MQATRRRWPSVVYNGRMGNRPGTDDGYNFRGAGYLQTTGRDNFIRYGKLVGIDFATDPPPSTDDTDALSVMAAAEWAAGRCNEMCEAGNFSGACAIINVGNASLDLQGRRHGRSREMVPAHHDHVRQVRERS